jgi:hypothetical protein
MMKFSKLAVLGAVLTASATFAHAAPLLAGNLIISDSPATVTGLSGGVFDLTSVYVGTGTFGNAQPGPTSGLPTLSNFGFQTITLGLFDSATSSLPDATIFTGQNSGDTDTLTFTATSFGTPVMGAGGDGSIIIGGYFTDSLGTYAKTFGSDDVTYDASGNGSITEDFTVTPEPNSLILLGTGMLGAAGLLFRRRLTA